MCWCAVGIIAVAEAACADELVGAVVGPAGGLAAAGAVADGVVVVGLCRQGGMGGAG